LNFEYMHSAQKAHDTTLDDEKYDMHYSQRRPIGKRLTDGTQHIQFHDGAFASD